MADATFDLSELTNLVARIEGADAKVVTRLRSVMGDVTALLQERVRQNIRSVFRPGSGQLARSIYGTTSANGDVMTSTVGSAGVPYARIQEYGGKTSAHTILPKFAKVLAFPVLGGALPIGKSAAQEMVFAKVVHHPGSTLPERSFLRRALAQSRGDIETMLLNATSGALADAGFKMAAD
jgi:phage gpG-like protein